jgi:rhodanese-related sulfurtransferase
VERRSSVRTAAELVAEAKERVENLSADATAQEVEAGDALLVDIREPGERREQGYIEGAVEAPRGMLEFWADPTSPYHREEFKPERRIVLHCASGGRSALAAAMLQELGYTKVAHMDGGLKAWKEAGRPVREQP